MTDGDPGDMSVRRGRAPVPRLLLRAAIVAGTLLVVGLAGGPAHAEDPTASPLDDVGQVAEGASAVAETVEGRAAGSAGAATGVVAAAAGSVTEPDFAAASPPVPPVQDPSGVTSSRASNRSRAVEAEIAGGAAEVRVAAEPEHGAVEVDATSAILRARARLDVRAPTVAASLDVGGLHAGLELSPVPPAGALDLTVGTGRLPSGRLTEVDPTKEALGAPRRHGAASEGLAHARGLSVPALEPHPGTDISAGEGDRSQSPPSPLPGITAGFGSAPRFHNLSEHAVPAGVLALLALTLAGRLFPGRSRPRPGLPQPIVVPG